MNTPLQQLVNLLSLEQLEQNVFCGQNANLGYGGSHGGQALGQALSAVYKIVSEDRHAHSFHCYFLRKRDLESPVIYTVDTIRSGNSFETFHVSATQEGQSILTFTASFQTEEKGFEHHASMPVVDSPDDLSDEYELRLQFKHMIPPKFQDVALARYPIEVRPAEPKNFYLPTVKEATNKLWFRAAGALPDDQSVHNCILAYASDFQILPTTLFPHGVSFFQPNMQVASLDHAMWFHRPFRADDWLLYSIDSPSSSGGRGLGRGQIFNQQGQLVASTMQEGIIRPKG
ncbi:MAG: thioesterase family protein [Endozoicomonas sp. (ex Botrylloides leachii)]|nr:thioesterase family protein [Endozoicomonas sp. (ex Botrylloides leachii)]